jgi:hypothetical protein
MVFVPALNVIECVPAFRNSQTLQISKNVLNFRKVAGSVNAADLETISTTYGTWFTGAGNDKVSSQISLESISTRDLTAEASFIDTNVMAPAIAGALASAVMPMSVTLAFKLATGIAGRSYRGRVYFVGLAEASVTGDYVAVGDANSIRDALVALNTAMHTAGYELVVVSRYHEGVVRENAVVTPVTSISYVDLRVDTQRRRLAGVGE